MFALSACSSARVPIDPCTNGACVVEYADLPTYPDFPIFLEPKNHFLQGTADGLNLEGLVDLDGSEPDIGVLTFANADFAGDTSTDAIGGMAFVLLQHVRATQNVYSSILLGTSLGVPLPAYVNTTPATAVWDGVAQGRGVFWTSNSPQIPFKLTVDFENTEIRGLIPIADTNAVSLNGNFNGSGVISGTVQYGNYTDTEKTAIDTTITTGVNAVGMLTGLIGKEGAVGAFLINNDESFNTYTGGFVARPFAN